MYPSCVSEADVDDVISEFVFGSRLLFSEEVETISSSTKNCMYVCVMEKGPAPLTCTQYT